MVWYFISCVGAFVAMYCMARGPGRLPVWAAVAMAALFAPLSLVTVIVVAAMAVITWGEE